MNPLDLAPEKGGWSHSCKVVSSTGTTSWMADEHGREITWTHHVSHEERRLQRGVGSLPFQKHCVAAKISDLHGAVDQRVGRPEVDQEAIKGIPLPFCILGQHWPLRPIQFGWRPKGQITNPILGRLCPVNLRRIRWRTECSSGISRLPPLRRTGQNLKRSWQT